MVRAPDLKYGDPKFKSLSDHQLDLFQREPGLTPQRTSTRPKGLLSATWNSKPVKFISMVCFIGPEKCQWGREVKVYITLHLNNNNNDNSNIAITPIVLCRF